MNAHPRTLRRRVRASLAGFAVAVALGGSSPAAISGPRLAGTAECDEPAPCVFHGRAVGAREGAPIASAAVRGPEGRILARTDGEGRFRLDGAQAGERHVVHAPGRMPAVFLADDGHERAERAAPIALEPAAALTVRVYDERLRPLAEAEIVLRPRAAAEFALGGEEERWTATTNARGSCRFAALPADRPLRASVRYEGRSLREIAWPLRLEAGERPSVGWVVDRGSDRDGIVLDSGGAPVAGLALWLVRNDGDPFERRRARHLSADAATAPLHEVVTDAEGRFALPHLAHGWYRIGPAPGGDRVPLAVPLEHDLRDAATTIRLEAACGRRVAGRVLGADGEPVPGARVYAEQPGVAGVLTAPCDADGHFDLPAAPRATLHFLARDERFGFETEVVAVGAEVGEVTLRFE